MGIPGIRVGIRGMGVGMLRIRGMWEIRVGMWGIGVGMWGIGVGMWGIRVGMSGIGVGMGNQGDSLWELSCLLLRLKFRSARGAF